MGMMAKSLSCLPLDTVGSGAQIQKGRKCSGTIVDTHSSEVQLSHVNNEKNGARTPVSMQIWNSQKVTRKAIILTSQVKSFSEVAVVVSFALLLFRLCFDLVCV